MTCDYCGSGHGKLFEAAPWLQELGLLVVCSRHQWYTDDPLEQIKYLLELLQREAGSQVGPRSNTILGPKVIAPDLGNAIELRNQAWLDKWFRDHPQMTRGEGSG